MGPTNYGKPNTFLTSCQDPFRGKFDFMVLIYPTFVYKKTYDRFVDHDWCIVVIDCPQEEVDRWLKLSSHFFRERTHPLFWTMRCLEGRERPHRPAGFSRLFLPPCRHQFVGSDTAGYQHFKTIPRKRNRFRSALQSVEENHESHLWRLRRWALLRRVQGADG